uniref:Uncharacterized protein n=1 Tax=Magallana gigas TaxID=29159 RepID=A0A8W8MQ21_MAGGI
MSVHTYPLVLLLLPVWEISYFVRCDSLVLWYYVQPAHMDVVDSLSTASGADTVPSLDFDLITTVESENLWCEQCKVFKKNYEKLQEEHALSYNTLKKKIISTDLLIKKYKSKCEDHDQQTRKLEDSVKKQEQLQREAETLQSQLSAALRQIEPLKQEKLVHDQEKRRQLQEIQTLRDQIVAGESFKTQYEQLNRSLLEGKEKHDQEIKDANKRIRELEQSQQKQEIQLTKLKGESRNLHYRIASKSFIETPCDN